MKLRCRCFVFRVYIQWTGKMSSSSSREYSPDWLRSQQAAETTSIWTLLTSSSESAREEEEEDQLPISSVVTQKLNTKRNRLDGSKGGDIQAKKPQESQSSVWDWPSDSDHDLSQAQQLPKVEDAFDTFEEETPLKKASKLEPSKKKRPHLPAETKVKSVTEQENDDVDDLKALEREATNDKQTGHYISSSRLPLLLSDKVQRSKVLVECEGESIDLSGDLGSVGRVIISDAPSGNQDMLLDLKGTIYKTTIMPSRTLCVVSFGQSEAKIEAIMNDFIQLKPQSNVYEAETMVEGTLEGFSFESEDEGDKNVTRQTDENEGGEPQTNGKSRGKSEAAKKKKVPTATLR